MKFIDKANVFAFLNSNNMRAQVTKGTASSFIIQGGFAGLSFITATFLARMLGSEGYGAYSNAIAWANIFTALSLFGFNSLLLRDIAILQAQNNWALVKGLLRFSDGLILAISLILSFILLATASLLFSSLEKEQLRFTLWIAAPLIPLWTLANLRQSAIRGLQHITHAMLPDLIFRPILTLACIVGVYLLWPKLLNSQISMALSVGSAIIALAIAIVWLQNFLPKDFGKVDPQYQIKEWLKVSSPMFVFGVTQIIISQAPIVILGLFSTTENVGYFTVVSRVANLLIFLPIAVSIVMGPLIARLNSQGEKVRLQNILKRTARLTFAVTLLGGSVFLIFGKNILSVFGLEFTIAYKALIMLVIGYLVDTGLGISIITLTMTGHERTVANYQIVSVVMLIVLCSLLTPLSGYEGAALASMGIMIFSRLIFALVVIKKTGLNTTIF